jgi:signal transduction histidine kinase
MTDQPQEAARSAGGGEKGNHATLAARRRKMHREETIEKLRALGLLQQVLDDAAKLSDQTYDLDPVMVQRSLLTMQKHSLRLARIVEDMLTISRLENGSSALNIEPFTVRGCVQDALDHIGTTDTWERIESVVASDL